jgi:hypothetical protein
MSAGILAGRGAMFGTLAAGMALLALVIVGLLFLKDPLAPLLLIGMAVAGTLGLLLLQRPFTATLIAWFLILLPPGDLRFDETTYTLAANGAVLAALGAGTAQAMGRPGTDPVERYLPARPALHLVGRGDVALGAGPDRGAPQAGVLDDQLYSLAHDHQSTQVG